MSACTHSFSEPGVCDFIMICEKLPINLYFFSEIRVQIDETLSSRKSYLTIFIFFFAFAIYVWQHGRAEEMSEIDKFNLLFFTKNWAPKWTAGCWQRCCLSPSSTVFLSFPSWKELMTLSFCCCLFFFKRRIFSPWFVFIYFRYKTQLKM